MYVCPYIIYVCVYMCMCMYGASGNESACQCRSLRVAGSVPESGRSHGGEHGNPLQYSCLENPMDRGAWWSTVHGVVKSQTLAKWLSTHAWTHIYICMYIPGANSVILESDRTKFGAGFYPLLTTISSKGRQVRYHQHSRVPGKGEMFNRELLDCKRTVSVYFLKLDSLGRIPAQSLPVWSWVSHFTTLWLNVFIWETGIVLLPIL